MQDPMSIWRFSSKRSVPVPLDSTFTMSQLHSPSASLKFPRERICLGKSKGATVNEMLHPDATSNEALLQKGHF